MDILTLLQEEAHRFSKGQRALSCYIRESYDKAAFMTAAALGKAVGVSESTVVRFAMELGYNGYPAMQKAMQETVVNRLTSAQRIGVANEQIGNGDILTSVIRSDMEMLHKTQELVDRKAFLDSVETIVKARSVYVIGVRASAPLASFLGHYLSILLERVQVITDSDLGAALERMLQADHRDVLIGISFPKYAACTSQAAEYARSKGVKVIGITDSSASPLGRCSDRVLLAKSNMISIVDSLTAPMSVINALITALASRREGELQARFAELEQVWAQYRVYEK